jgi:hypothetical protein
MLKKDRSGSPEWLTKLPQMAKQLEVLLYRNARSFDAYMDMDTLKQRLLQIAANFSQKARSQEQRHDRLRDSQPSANGMIQDSSSPFTGNSSANMNSNTMNHNSVSSSGMQGVGASMNIYSSGGYAHSMNNSNNVSASGNMSGGGPSLLEIASAHATIASSQAAIARSLAINDKRQCLETEFRMLMEVGYIDEAKGVLEQVKNLRRELASPPPPLPVIVFPH